MAAPNLRTQVLLRYMLVSVMHASGLAGHSRAPVHFHIFLRNNFKIEALTGPHSPFIHSLHDGQVWNGNQALVSTVEYFVDKTVTTGRRLDFSRVHNNNLATGTWMSSNFSFLFAFIMFDLSLLVLAAVVRSLNDKNEITALPIITHYRKSMQ